MTVIPRALLNALAFLDLHRCMLDAEPLVQDVGNLAQRDLSVRTLVYLCVQRHHDLLSSQRPGMYMVYATYVGDIAELALNRLCIEARRRAFQQDVRRIRS